MFLSSLKETLGWYCFEKLKSWLDAASLYCLEYKKNGFSLILIRRILSERIKPKALIHYAMSFRTLSCWICGKLLIS